MRRLGHPYLGSTAATLANGSTVRLDYHEGRLLWHGREFALAVFPLVGTALLGGNRLTVDAMPGGIVRVEDLTG